MKIIERLQDRILQHPRTVLSVIVAITLPLAVVLSSAPIETALLSSFVADREFYEHYRERAAMFQGDADSVLYIATNEGEQLFQAKTLNAIREAAAQMRTIPGVTEVTTIVDCPQPGRESRSFREVAALAVIRKKLSQGELPDDIRPARPYWPTDPKAQAAVDLEKLRERMTSDSLIYGTLLAKDGRGHAMMVELADFHSFSPLEQSRIVRRLEAIPQEFGLGAEGVYSTGLPVIQSRTFEYILQALVLLLSLGFMLISGVVYWAFRRVLLVVLTMLIATLAIIWAMGTTVLCFGTITVLVAAVPLMVLVISTSETIHIISAYLEEIKSGFARRDAIRKVSHEVGGACILTSFTTFVGFLSLLQIPSATTQHFAVAVSVGVASALLLSLTIVPLALYYLGDRLGLQAAPVAQKSGLDGRVVNLIGGWCIAHYRLVAAAGLIAIPVVAWYSRDLQLDFDLTARFPESNPVRRSIQYFNDEFSGTSVIEVFVDAPGGELLSPENLEAISRFQAECVALGDVESAFSIISLFELGDREIGFQTDSGMPASTAMAGAYLRLIDTEDPRVLPAWVDAERTQARIALRCKFTSFLDAEVVGRRLRNVAERTLPESVSADISGSSMIIGSTVRQIIAGQYNGFYLCFVTVLVLMALGLRSLRLGLVALPSSILPIVFLWGCVRLSGRTIDSDILGVATVSLGLADSDTIHFLHRYQLERRTAESKVAAVKTALRYTGQATVRSAAVLMIGFAPFALSEYFSLRIIGTYLVFVLLMGVLAELSMTPAMLMLIEPEGPPAAAPQPTPAVSDPVSP